MATESSKSAPRRETEGFFTRYCTGRGIDIGCGDDPLLPGMDTWDLEQGDGQYLSGVADETYDFVYSSHFLEHVRDPHCALRNQWRILRPGGYLLGVVPDEDLYEQGIWPSLFNIDHKLSYTIHKDKSWSPRSFNLVDILSTLPEHKIIYIKTIDQKYDYTPRTDGMLADQTMLGAEAGIEFVVQKQSETSQLRSRLRKLLRCPKCTRLDLMLRGITAENELDVQCGACGFFGRLQLKEATK
jgi:SAM-dependent methyltransferase